MRSPAIVDTSALFAAADASELDHRACLDVLGRLDLDLVIPAAVEFTDDVEAAAKTIAGSARSMGLQVKE